MSTVRHLLGFLGLILLFGCASADVPQPHADFTANITIGTDPMPVSFTDTSSNGPTGWVWWFGDEQYNTSPWTRVNASSGWIPRTLFTAVVLPDHSILLTGGNVPGNSRNDSWKSSDSGRIWTMVNASAGWIGGKYGHSTVVVSGNIVLTGGNGGSIGVTNNETWQSLDSGRTWKLVNPSSGWTARSLHSSVAMPDGSIVLMGGVNSSVYMNDVWRSADNGRTWTLVNANAEWPVRSQHTSVVMPDGSIVLMGGKTGSYKNDVWRSTDAGVTWTEMNHNAAWTPRFGHTSVALPDGSIILMGGLDGSVGYRNDTWRSPDEGTTWIRVNASPGWLARDFHASVSMPDGSVVLMGGMSNGIRNNEVWGFQPIGSTEQNPVHTYTAPGIYNVTLRAFNLGGYTTERKIGYINVTEASFSKIGVFRNSHDWLLDNNGNGAWDDVAGGDMQYALGKAGDIATTGDWNGNGKSEMGTIRLNSTDNRYYWSVDYNGNGLWDGVPGGDQKWILGKPGDIAVAGDWDHGGKTEMGTVRLVNTTPDVPGQRYVWSVDYNGNGIWDGVALGDQKWTLGQPGDTPVVGDWNGDGYTEMGTVRLNAAENKYYWSVDYNRNGLWDGIAGGDQKWVLGKPGDTPVAGDWNGNGYTKMGTFRLNTTDNQYYWSLDYNGNGLWDGKVTDRQYIFGIAGDIPVIGKW